MIRHLPTGLRACTVLAAAVALCLGNVQMVFAAVTIRISEPLPQIVRLHLGDTLEIDLGAQLASGFSWNLETAEDHPVTLRDTKIIVAPGTEKYADGLAERQLFVLVARKKGEGKIGLKYGRPWEADPARRLSVKVVVD